MFTRRSFLASFGSTLALLTGWRPGWAQTTHRATVTFVLFNDFYLMAEQPFPDGKSRGGFARLAAVVKAERERARTEGRTVRMMRLRISHQMTRLVSITRRSERNSFK